MNKTIKQFISKILLVCMFFVSSGLETVMTKAETGSTVYEYEGYDVTYNVKAEWQTGQQIEVMIANTDDEPIKNWCIEFNAGGSIENLWDATVESQNAEQYVIRNNGHNEEIPVDGSIKFGYVLSGENIAAPESFILTQEKREVSEDYEIQYLVTNDWGTGFQGILSILNKSDELIEDWQISFDSNVDFDNVWNAD